MDKLKLIFILLMAVFTTSLMAQEVGNATYYSSKLKGRKTTDGSRYHPDSLTCAHKTYPLGTLLLVENPVNNERVVVKVTDRGPFSRNLMIDLSYAAAQKLDIIRKGIANVTVVQLDPLFQSLVYLPVKLEMLTVNEMKPVLYKMMFKQTK